MGLSFSEPVLLVAGRFHHKKGLDLLPKVLRRLASRPWQIVLIGTDEDGAAEHLKSSLKRAGLGDRCHWLDHVPTDQLVGPYNAADCLLMPSRHENFGNVVIEALACGCAVLISDHVGVGADISTCPGVTIRPRSSSLWSTELLSILDSPRPGSNSADWVRKYFSHKSLACQALRLYESIPTHG